MTQTVLKYVLPNGPGSIMLHLPDGARFLHVHMQHGKAVVYVRQTPVPRWPFQVQQVRWTITAAETGKAAPDSSSVTYLGTALFYDGDYVLHYFASRPEWTRGPDERFG